MKGEIAQFLAVGDEAAKELEEKGYCFGILKPYDIEVGDNVLVTHPSYESPLFARFVHVGSTLWLTT